MSQPGLRGGQSRQEGKRVLILTASAGSGHNVAAAVLEHHARASPDVEDVRTLDVLQLTGDLYRRLYDDAYFKLVNAVPWVVCWSYDTRDAPFSDRDPLWLWDQLNTTEVARAIHSYEPDVVLSTHFLPARVVSLLRSRGQIHSTTSCHHHRLRFPVPLAQRPVQSVLRRTPRDKGARGRDRLAW